MITHVQQQNRPSPARALAVGGRYQQSCYGARESSFADRFPFGRVASDVRAYRRAAGETITWHNLGPGPLEASEFRS